MHEQNEIYYQFQYQFLFVIADSHTNTFLFTWNILSLQILYSLKRQIILGLLEQKRKSSVMECFFQNITQTFKTKSIQNPIMMDIYIEIEHASTYYM